MELLLISNFVCSGMLAIHYTLPQSDQLDLTLNLNTESELQKKWRHNLFIWTDCSEVTTWAGHFLKMVNKMNLQQWHCQGQQHFPADSQHCPQVIPPINMKADCEIFFYRWLVLTSANILPAMSIFRVRSHSCTANRQCSKFPRQFPVCSPCRNISEYII